MAKLIWVAIDSRLWMIRPLKRRLASSSLRCRFIASLRYSMSFSVCSSGMPVDSIFGAVRKLEPEGEIKRSRDQEMKRSNHRKEIDKDVGVAAEDVVALATKVDEALEGFAAPRSHHVGKLWGQHKRSPFPLDSGKLFVVAEKVAKIDVFESSADQLNHHTSRIKRRREEEMKRWKDQEMETSRDEEMKRSRDEEIKR